MRPLEGIKVVEMAGVFAVPYCAMLLADFGADVVVVDRVSTEKADHHFTTLGYPFDRGKRSIRVNLKSAEGIDCVRRLIHAGDVLLDSYRPGVMESLGLGPEESLSANPQLIYARLSGWGQTGPYAHKAGHDMNYLALSGALSILPDHDGQPVPPLSYMGDLAGGGLFCALGILLALMERGESGQGQMIDHAMLDGIANLSTPFYAVCKQNPNLLTLLLTVLGAKSPYYQCYETKDGKYLSVGPVEARFYDELLEKLGIAGESFPSRDNMKQWPEISHRIRHAFKTKTREEWVATFEGSDACVEPVLDLDDAPTHPHNVARGVFETKDCIPTPAPAPRLARTPGIIGEMEKYRGQGTRSVMTELGYSQAEIDALLEKGIVE